MRYISTRGGESPGVTAGEAILKGIAEDGGLYVPESIPVMDKSLEALLPLNYCELGYEILKLYLTDYTEDELKDCIWKAYGGQNFSHPLLTPLREVQGKFFLELFHGRTLAFKDMALSILPHLLKTAAEKKGLEKEILILTATSGDTGKAALEGFAGVNGTKIIVFFPEDGVSSIQKMQMVTQTGENTFVIGIRGNFDDAQTGVKKIFTDKALAEELDKKDYLFSSANSINIGRLTPQIIYYYDAYFQMVKQGHIALGDKLDFTVPTGNFGNILAGWYAKAMGLPVGTLICASNENKVLYDFFATGEYNKNRAFHLTSSPSMDILISSNLERLLYHNVGAAVTKELMENLNKTGVYHFAENPVDFVGCYATENEMIEGIREMFAEGYLIDPHTAVAYQAFQKYRAKSGTSRKNVIISTASPFKFTETVCRALGVDTKDTDPFALLDELAAVSKCQVPMPLAGIGRREVLHKSVCEVCAMEDEVKRIIKYTDVQTDVPAHSP